MAGAAEAHRLQSDVHTQWRAACAHRVTLIVMSSPRACHITLLKMEFLYGRSIHLCTSILFIVLQAIYTMC